MIWSRLFSQLAAKTLLLLFAAIAFAIFTISTPALAVNQSQTFDLNQRPAADVAAQIRDLYDDVNVAVIGQRMVVRADDQILQEIGQIVQQLDVATVQFKISVQTRENSSGKHNGGGFGFTSNTLSPRGNTVTITAQSKTTRSSGDRERSLVVQDGQSAQISAGQIRSLPFGVRGGRNPIVLLQSVASRSGFVVTPRMISPQNIELSIMSFEQDAPALQGYDTEALVTIRRVEPGQWVSLGGVDQSESRENAGIVYRVNSSGNRNSQIRVRVDILP